MIDKNIECFFMKQSDTFLKPASEVAVLLDEHNISHAKILLSQYKYSKVPVINENREFVGIQDGRILSTLKCNMTFSMKNQTEPPYQKLSIEKLLRFKKITS